MPEQIIARVAAHADTLLASMDLELVDVQFRREGHGWVLRLIIDHAQGVNVDHCAAVSREMSAWLDVEDLIDIPYHLEVSSPGLDRPLKKPADFQRFTGSRVKVRLRGEIEGRKTFIGDLLEADGEGITVEQDGRPVRLPFELIRESRLAM